MHFVLYVHIYPILGIVTTWIWAQLVCIFLYCVSIDFSMKPQDIVLFSATVLMSLLIRPSQATSGRNGTVTALTNAQCVTQVAEIGPHIKHGAVDIHLCHWSTINGPSLATTVEADIIWVSPSWRVMSLHFCGPTAWIAGTWVIANSTVADSTKYLP